MSATIPRLPRLPRLPRRRWSRWARRPRVWVPAAVVVLLAMSAIRTFGGTEALTGSGVVSTALRLAVPIGLAGLSGLWSERAGVANLGIEGMMIIGTVCGAWAGYTHGVWAGVLAGVLGGVAAGLLHAVVTVTFGVDQAVCGIAINILAVGVARFLSVIAFSDLPGAGATQSPPVKGVIGTVSVPLLAGGWGTPDILGQLEQSRWFLISDVSGILRGLLHEVSWFTLLAVALILGSVLVLWHTAFGLRLRSAGEHPAAADSLGVRVHLMRYCGVLVSGGLAGLAGAYLVTVSSNVYREGQTGGRGFIGLAAMIFGNWRPTGTAGGALLFGYADALQLRQAAAMHTLLLLAAVLLWTAAIVVLRRRPRLAAALALLGAIALAVFQTTDSIPTQLIYATPYLTTLLVLVTIAQRLRMPAYVGIPYRRGDS
ncbi:simple sugar transport system permease protein [Streptosporangium becharense]|uniref:Simple sugar transport system permease protein n=1 Tax=Streptosporangium becharense TaxID=1816182 RepID=A0A7W9MIS0_9ACTN|nr:ABC transporter permease [Streptosporangium becharense]MBB2911690.1 simple sugar transport system permease protein [Streptosporangium becharense]MBB5822492.1 simple sugar transport system permease protein [Streptosporangium becharense]